MHDDAASASDAAHANVVHGILPSDNTSCLEVPSPVPSPCRSNESVCGEQSEGRLSGRTAARSTTHTGRSTTHTARSTACPVVEKTPSTRALEALSGLRSSLNGFFSSDKVWNHTVDTPGSRHGSFCADDNVKRLRSTRSGTSRLSSHERHLGNLILFDDVVAAKKGHENAKLQADTRFLIMPWSTFLTLWRTVMVVVVLWAVIFAPFELAFSWWTPSIFFEVISKLVDLLCICDMFMNFSIVTIKYGRLVTKRKQIAKIYIRSWFFIDLLTNIPWDFLLHSNGKSRKVIKVLKLPKVLRLTRLLRVAREEAHTLGTVFTISGMLLLTHYYSCLWVVMLIDCDEHEQCPRMMDAYTEGLSVGMATLSGSDAWLRFAVEGSNLGSGSNFDWRSPPGVGVELASVGTTLAGFCAMGMLFANIARAMDKQDSHTRKFNERLRNTKAAADQHSMHKDIFTRARRHFHYVWSCGSDASRELLADQTLSVDLRRELAFSFYGDLLRKVPFLQNAEENLLKQLCRWAKMEVFSPMDNIVMAGESGDELFFLASGSVNVMSPTTDVVLKTLHEGSFFGEVALFNHGGCHNVNVKASSFGWLLIIDRVHIEELCDEELLEAFRLVAMERQEIEFAELGRNAYLGARAGPGTPTITMNGMSAAPTNDLLAPVPERSPVQPSRRGASDTSSIDPSFLEFVEAKIDEWASALERRISSLEVRPNESDEESRSEIGFRSERSEGSPVTQHVQRY